MKKVITSLFVSLVSILSFGQAPQAFAFQSTLTDTLGAPFANQSVAVQFDIHSISGNGTVVYSETHSAVPTSASGYFSANVGEGSVNSGDFSSINWGNSSYWLEVLVDTTGGSSFVSLGSSQLLSVPYALNAGNSTSTLSAYYVGAYTGPAITALTTIIYDVTTIERGITYNAATGIFTVISSGIYEIDATITAAFVGSGDINISNGDTQLITANSNIFELTINDTFWVTTDDCTGATIRIKEIK